MGSYSMSCLHRILPAGLLPIYKQRHFGISKGIGGVGGGGSNALVAYANGMDIFWNHLLRQVLLSVAARNFLPRNKILTLTRAKHVLYKLSPTH